jgi:hypothetical protein
MFSTDFNETWMFSTDFNETWMLSTDFYETWMFSTDFRKNSNIKFHENLSSGGFSMRTDGRRDEEANSRFSQFCERAKKRIMKEQVPY